MNRILDRVVRTAGVLCLARSLMTGQAYAAQEISAAEQETAAWKISAVASDDSSEAAVEQMTESVLSAEEQRKIREGGSAGLAEGRAVVVTIFAGDRMTRWTDQAADLQKEDTICTYLGRACDYISGQARNWGRELDFVWDFEEHEDLRYEMSSDVDFQKEDADEDVWAFVDASVPSESLKKTYGADSILYIVATNTDETNEGITATRSWYEGMPYPYEYVNLYYVDSGLIQPPAVYAHEMLHTFGAPDLYEAYEDDGVTSQDITWIEQNRSNDIMYTCSDLKSGDYVYDTITNEVTDVTAWYLGWTDTLPDGYGAG